MAESKQKQYELDSAAQNATIGRAVVAWINTCPYIPCRVDYNFLGKTSGMAVGTVQSAVKTRQYIYGGYRGQYQFEIAYRLIASNADERIAADELLDKIAEWMEQNTPEPPTGVNWWRINRSNSAALLNAYDNGAEDHTAPMTIQYEVI